MTKRNRALTSHEAIDTTNHKREHAVAQIERSNTEQARKLLTLLVYRRSVKR